MYNSALSCDTFCDHHVCFGGLVHLRFGHWIGWFFMMKPIMQTHIFYSVYIPESFIDFPLLFPKVSHINTQPASLTQYLPVATPLTGWWGWDADVTLGFIPNVWSLLATNSSFSFTSVP